MKKEKKMTEEEIKKMFDDIQQKLETLQDEKASFMFLGNVGNHFTIAGNPTDITAQLSFAMMRYPIVRDIIKNCAEKFDELNALLGKEVKNMKLDHQIEQNSGRL